MNIENCTTCEHCNLHRTNDIGEIRCERFSTFVDALHRCDSYLSKYSKLQELADKLKKE